MVEAFEDITSMPGLWSNYDKSDHPHFGGGMSQGEPKVDPKMASQPSGSTAEGVESSSAGGHPTATVPTTSSVTGPRAPSPEADGALVVSDDATLHSLGVSRCNVGASVALDGWAEELSKVTPLSEFLEDGEYAQYRNIVDDPTFPFDVVRDSIAATLEAHFIKSMAEVRLDDAFAIHYNERSTRGFGGKGSLIELC